MFTTFTKYLAKFFSLVSVSPASRMGLYFTMVDRVPFLSILSPGPDFIHLSPSLDVIKLVRVWIVSILCPGPRSGPGFNKVVRKSSAVRIFIIF